jgi:hypothetical protein
MGRLPAGALTAVRTIEGPGYRIDWDSEGEGYARIVVKAAASQALETAEEWLREDRWCTYEFTGDDAFERALKAALDDIWPDRTPYRIP